MDAEGYSGQELQSASNNDKIVLFLVPLQEEINTEPFPFDAEQFTTIPQVPCFTCNSTMPLQILALHAGKCQPMSNRLSLQRLMKMVKMPWGSRKTQWKIWEKERVALFARGTS